MTTEIHGFVKPGFEPVQRAFEKNFAEGLEQGASMAVTKDGELVVDLWGGSADPTGRPWEQDTIVNVYSTTKTMAAICVLMLADRGEVDLSAPVANYWPEFANNGKENVTVSHVMSHTAGISAFDPGLESVDLLYDWDACVERLANQAPLWEPGTKSGYHAITQGYLQGEIVRRVTGRSIGTFFREEVAEPLGADFHIGLPASEDDRVADLVPPAGGLAAREGGPARDSIAAQTFRSAPITGEEPRTREWRGAEIPAAGGTGERALGRARALRPRVRRRSRRRAPDERGRRRADPRRTNSRQGPRHGGPPGARPGLRFERPRRADLAEPTRLLLGRLGAGPSRSRTSISARPFPTR